MNLIPNAYYRFFDGIFFKLIVGGNEANLGPFFLNANLKFYTTSSSCKQTASLSLPNLKTNTLSIVVLMAISMSFFVLNVFKRKLILDTVFGKM